MLKPTDAQIEAAVAAEQARLRTAAQQPPPPFIDKRPAPMSDGARTVREAAEKNAKFAGGNIPLVP